VLVWSILPPACGLCAWLALSLVADAWPRAPGVATDAPAGPIAAEAVPEPCAPDEPGPSANEGESEHFTIHSSLPLRLDRIAAIAERGCAEAARLTTLPVPDAKVPICICRDSDEFESLKLRFGFSGPRRGQGTFYASVPLVLVWFNPWMDGTVAHEVTHWVIWHSAPHCPSMLNEGAAVLVAERVAEEVRIDEGFPSGARTPSMLERPRALRRYSTSPVFERAGFPALLRTDPYDYHADWGAFSGLPRPAGRGEFHDLSWCLAKALEERGAGLGTSAGAVFQRVRSARSEREAIDLVLSVRGLEEAWSATVLREAAAR
jgi:hypothetical protein